MREFDIKKLRTKYLTDHTTNNRIIKLPKYNMYCIAFIVIKHD